jgi:hypothetical protein
MSSQIVDYAAMLADLEAKKAVIESTISAIKAAMAAGALGIAVGDASKVKDAVAMSISSQPFDGDIPSGLFTGKSIPEAAKLYLSMVNRKQTTKEIAAALEEGGLHTTADNFAPTVEAGLNRASKKSGEIVRVKGQWALAAWYKGMRVGPQEAARPKKKGKRKAKAATKKVTKSAPEPTVAEAPRPAMPSRNSGSGGPQFQVESYFNSHPGEEFSAAELASTLSIRIQTVAVACAKLVKAGRLERAASGKFRTAKLHAMPKAV